MKIIAGHAFNESGENAVICYMNGSHQNCIEYHYLCADCGIDCTQRTPAGPAVRAIDGVTRCRECDYKLPRFSAVGKAAVAAQASPALVNAIKKAIEYFADTPGSPDYGELQTILDQALEAAGEIHA